LSSCLTPATPDTGRRGVLGHEKLSYFRVFTGQFLQENLGDIIGAAFMELPMYNRNLHLLSSPPLFSSSAFCTNILCGNKIITLIYRKCRELWQQQENHQRKANITEIKRIFTQKIKTALEER
jgi:hypothetical protein